MSYRHPNPTKHQLSRSLPFTFPTHSTNPLHREAALIYLTGTPSPTPCNWCSSPALLALLPFPSCILPAQTADPFNEHCANSHFWLGETSLYDESYDRGDVLRAFDQKCQRLMRACVDARREGGLGGQTEEERRLGRALTVARAGIAEREGGEWCVAEGFYCQI